MGEFVNDQNPESPDKLPSIVVEFETPHLGPITTDTDGLVGLVVALYSESRGADTVGNDFVWFGALQEAGQLLATHRELLTNEQLDTLRFGLDASGYYELEDDPFELGPIAEYDS